MIPISRISCIDCRRNKANRRKSYTHLWCERGNDLGCQRFCKLKKHNNGELSPWYRSPLFWLLRKQRSFLVCLLLGHSMSSPAASTSRLKWWKEWMSQKSCGKTGTYFSYKSIASVAIFILRIGRLYRGHLGVRKGSQWIKVEEVGTSCHRTVKPELRNGRDGNLSKWGSAHTDGSSLLLVTGCNLGKKAPQCQASARERNSRLFTNSKYWQFAIERWMTPLNCKRSRPTIAYSR